jgi:hypothetical protein
MYRRELILARVVFPRQKIIMYNEFGVLLACENIGKFLAVRGSARDDPLRVSC